MTAMPISRPAEADPDEFAGAFATMRLPGLVAFAAILVLAATTGLPMGSAARLIPQPNDPDGPFLGI